MVSAIGISNIYDTYQINVSDKNFSSIVTNPTNEEKNINKNIIDDEFLYKAKEDFLEYNLTFPLTLVLPKSLDAYTQTKTELIKHKLHINESAPATDEQLKALDATIANTDFQQEFVDVIKSKLSNNHKEMFSYGGESFVGVTNRINYTGLSDENIGEIQDCINQCISDRGCSSLDETAKLGWFYSKNDLIEYTANKLYAESIDHINGDPDKLGCLSVNEWKDVLSEIEIDDYYDIRSIAQKSEVELSGSCEFDNAIIFNNFLKTLAQKDSIPTEIMDKITKFTEYHDSLLPRIAKHSIESDIQNSKICHYNQKLIDKYLLG